MNMYQNYKIWPLLFCHDAFVLTSTFSQSRFCLHLQWFLPFFPILAAGDSRLVSLIVMFKLVELLFTIMKNIKEMWQAKYLLLVMKTLPYFSHLTREEARQSLAE